jgi:hypothetical protein
MKKPVLNDFHWQGKRSSVIDEFGRIKTDRQRLLDANRTNPHSDICKSVQTNSEKAPR